MNTEQQYNEYRNELKKLNEQRDAWYTIAHQKFSEGNNEAQDRAYAEIDAIQEEIEALAKSQENELLSDEEATLTFDN